MQRAQAQLQNILTERLSELQSQNPRFSLRAFAGKVGLAPGALSGILNGKRIVSKKMAERIASRLMLDPVEQSKLISLFSPAPANSAIDSKSYLTLAANEFKLIADWEHKAILSLLKTKAKFRSVCQIAQRLTLGENQCDQALQRLVQLNLVRRTPAGYYVRTCAQLKTSDGVSDSSIRRAHEQSLELAKKSVQEISIDHRDIRSITMAINPKKINEARELIDEFHDRLSDLLESGPQSEVYRFTTALYPLTKLESKGTKK